MQRGRPRHDDVLTPREWQVLALIRDGLTNEQIAERLEISLATAKFHVSEIMGKLGVESRQAAAAWPGRPKVAFGLAPLAWLRNRAGSASLPRPVGIAVLVAATLGLLVLALGVVLMDARSTADRAAVPHPTPVLEPVTETTVIVYSPANPPPERVEGTACGPSVVLARNGVWRCPSQRGRGDPCFGEEGALEVVCPWQPETDYDLAYRVALEEPLAYATPPPAAAQLEPAQAWFVETADGRKCGFKSGGTSSVINGERVNFYCDDGMGLLGLPAPGKVWTARQVSPAMPPPGVLVIPEIVELRTVWR